jgi:hypothetical protein
MKCLNMQLCEIPGTVSNRLFLTSSVGCQVLGTVSEKQISKSQVWMNMVTLLQFHCMLPYFEPKINTRVVGPCKSQYWRGLMFCLGWCVACHQMVQGTIKCNCCHCSVIFHIRIKSRSFPDKATERSTLLCSFVLLQMFPSILRSTNPETGFLKLKTQQI